MEISHALTARVLVGCSYSWRPRQRGSLHRILQCTCWATCCMLEKLWACSLCRWGLAAQDLGKNANTSKHTWPITQVPLPNCHCSTSKPETPWQAVFCCSSTGSTMIKCWQWFGQCSWHRLQHRCLWCSDLPLCCRATAAPSWGGWTRASSCAPLRRWRHTMLRASAGLSWTVGPMRTLFIHVPRVCHSGGPRSEVTTAV